MTTVEPIRNLDDLEKIENLYRAQNFRNFILFCTGINTGLRISDILGLDVKDVKNKKYIKLKEKKTSKPKQIPINSKLKTLYLKYTKNRRPEEPLFITRRKNRLDRIMAYRIIKNTCTKIMPEGAIGTHTLRKTFGYHHYKKYKDVAMLQKIFNHSTPEVTLRYIGIEQDEIFESYKNLIL